MSDNTEYNLQSIHAKDARKIAELGKQTFRETYLSLMKSEDLEAHLKTAFEVPLIEDYLSSKEIFAFQATFRDELIGYSFFRAPSQPPAPLPELLMGEIGRLYIKKAYQGKGLGKCFLAKQFEIAKRLDLEGIWLSVWQKNIPALQFYQKCGFQIITEPVLNGVGDIQDDLILWKSC